LVNLKGDVGLKDCLKDATEVMGFGWSNETIGWFGLYERDAIVRLQVLVGLLGSLR
jgi:hypothetical protein